MADGILRPERAERPFPCSEKEGFRARVDCANSLGLFGLRSYPGLVSGNGRLVSGSWFPRNEGVGSAGPPLWSLSGGRVWSMAGSVLDARRSRGGCLAVDAGGRRGGEASLTLPERARSGTWREGEGRGRRGGDASLTSPPCGGRLESFGACGGSMGTIWLVSASSGQMTLRALMSHSPRTPKLCVIRRVSSCFARYAAQRLCSATAKQAKTAREG